MKGNISIQLKAALLLVIFGLNTVVGFACSMGVDMGFNTSHHHNEAVSEVHVHANGEKHRHDRATQSHAQNHKHKTEKDNCCNDSVIKLSQTDKAVPQSNLLINPVFFTAFITSFYTIAILYSSKPAASVKYFVLGHHPPIPDIRIAIQRFQI